MKFLVYDPIRNELLLSPNVKEHLGSWFDANCNLSIKNFKDKIFLRFTGLQDIKHEDIYEGYIVYIKDIGNVEIKFENGSFMFGSYFYHDITNDIQIIGNIYQNSDIELLS